MPILGASRGQKLDPRPRRARFLPRRGVSRDGSARALALAAIPLLLIAFCALLYPFTLGAPVADASPLQSGYLITLGSGSIYPGQSQVLIPLYLTNPAPVESFEMGLDYDEVFLHLVGISFDGTVSGGLAPPPQVLFAPASPPYSWFRVDYDPGAPFPAGESQLAAYLIFELAGEPIETSSFPISVIEQDGPPLLINDEIIPQVTPGEIEVLVGDVLEVGAGTGNNLTEIALPVRIWHEDDIQVLSMGLDYDEVFLLQVTVQGTPVEALDPAISVSVAGGVTLVTLDFGDQPLPAGYGDLILFLTFETPPENPVVGTFPVSLVGAETHADGKPIPNLLDGQITLLDEFLRGDANYNGTLELGDATTVLAAFLGQAELICETAADANDDDHVGVADAIYLLDYLFNDGSEPPPPFPGLGLDPSPGSLPCVE